MGLALLVARHAGYISFEIKLSKLVFYIEIDGFLQASLIYCVFTIKWNVRHAFWNYRSRIKFNTARYI